MRYRCWYPAKLGDKRISYWFALLPVNIEGEVRWLEWVTVEWIVVEKRKFLPPCPTYLTWTKLRYMPE
jgi:hypothetical protein